MGSSRSNGPHVRTDSPTPSAGYRSQARARLEARRLYLRRRTRRGRARAAGRAGGVGGGGARPEAGARGTCRFEGPYAGKREKTCSTRSSPPPMWGSRRSRIADVDVINIRQASLLAMCRALAALPCTPDMALVDGNDPPALPCKVEAIIKGDASHCVDRRRIHRRQGGARPADGAARDDLSGLWFPNQCRIRDEIASVGARKRRPLPVSPHDFFAIAPRVTGSVTELNAR